MSTGAETLLRLRLSREVAVVLGSLLSTRHLYQRIEIPSDCLREHVEHATVSARSDAERRAGVIQLTGINRADWITEEAHSAASRANSMASRIAALPWQPHCVDSATQEQGVGPLTVELPTIQTVCPNCERIWPFNPGTNHQWGSLQPIQLTLSGPNLSEVAPTLTGRTTAKAYVPSSLAESVIARLATEIVNLKHKTQQLLLLPYQCQQCKAAPVSFLVRRTGLKITLCGREPLETIQVPEALPKAQRKYFGDAIVANNAGQTLAGLFLLRTFVEQFWLSLSLMSKSTDERISGEGLGEAYGNTLPLDFRSRFPSLGDVYGKLSVAMHNADANVDLFEHAAQAIIEHFDARRVYKLESTGPELR